MDRNEKSYQGFDTRGLFGFEYLDHFLDTETAIGLAHNKRGIVNEGVPSDRRLKTDVLQVGCAENGLPLYDFRYVGSDAVFRGVVAQDVLEDGRFADAVETRQGYYCIDYSKLGLGNLVSAEMCMAGKLALASFADGAST